ncbi:thymidylate synthase [Actinopolyspora mortivallis]|uniref:thymidylate synthase n=1 Tax=Actinopolyspora mortivallis TaxID=33906 RepID=UPI00036737C5|nr:thymidylate synthase [Actinopolyspora mortivallis]
MTTTDPEFTRADESGYYADFHSAYVDRLRRVFLEPTFRNAPRGFASRERLAEQFGLRDPRQRVPFVPARRTNIVFNLAEALWYLSGRDDLEFIGYYAPGIRRYSMDGYSLTGTAYGARILGTGAGPSQWSTVTEQLREDPDTKRAVLQIFGSEELRVADNIDVACTLGLQFLLRDGALHAVSYMRANDAYRGLVSDLFSFTFLQEFMATELGVRPGSYTHTVGSLHVYASDEDSVRAVLADPAGEADPPFLLPAMPARNNWEVLGEVLEIEEALRTNRHRLDSGLTNSGMPEYWAQVLGVFEVYRRLVHDEPVTVELLHALDPSYVRLLGWRWGDRVPAGEVFR